MNIEDIKKKVDEFNDLTQEEASLWLEYMYKNKTDDQVLTEAQHQAMYRWDGRYRTYVDEIAYSDWLDSQSEEVESGTIGD